MKKYFLMVVLYAFCPKLLAENIPIIDISWETKEPTSGIRYEAVGDLHKYIIDIRNLPIYKQADVYFKDGKINYVTIISKTIDNDYFMEKSVSIYKGEKRKLARKYKEISSHEYIYLGNRYGKEAPLECLNYLDCGKYNTYYEDKNGNTVRLEIKAIDKNKSFIELSLQNSSF